MEIKKILIKVIKVGIVLVFFTPLILGPFSLNMSEYPKAVFFRSLIEIIFVFYIFLLLADKKYLPRFSPLLISVLIFDAVLIITSFFGINFYRSFFGDMIRGEGVIMHIHLLVFFIILLGVFSKKEEWLLLFKITAIISGVSSFAAILQAVGVSSFYGMEANRVSGTLSNPDIFGSYLTLSIFLAIFLLASEQKKYQKVLWIFLIILNFCTLVLSGTRGAWVGFGAGIIFLIICCYPKLNYRRRMIFLSVILAVSIIFLLIILFPGQFYFSQNLIFQRFISVFQFDIGNRLGLWKIAIVSFADRSIFGWGAESFSYVYDKYFKNSYLYIPQSSMYFDRPHNKFLEILSSNGIVGLISYSLIFFIIFYLIFSGRNQLSTKPKIIFSATLGAFFVSYVVQNIFLFDNICVYILFFLVAGFLNPVRKPERSELFDFSKKNLLEQNLDGLSNGVNNNFFNLKEKIPAGIAMPARNASHNEAGGQSVAGGEKKNRANFHFVLVKTAVGVFAVFFTAIVFYKINVEPTMASMNFINYIKYENTDIKKAFYGYLASSEKNMIAIYGKDIRMAFMSRSLFLFDSVIADPIRGDIINQFIKIRPIVYNNLQQKDQQMRNLYQFLFLMDEDTYLFSKNPQDLNNMEEDIKEAIKFNPEFGSFYQLEGELKILQNKNDEGQALMAKARDLNLWSDNPASNEVGYFDGLAVAYYKKGDIEKTVENLKKELNADYTNKKLTSKSAFNNPSRLFAAVNSLAVLYIRDFKNSKESLNTYQEAIKAYPEYKQTFENYLYGLAKQYQ